MKHLFLAISAFIVLGLVGEYAINKYNDQTLSQVSAIENASYQAPVQSNESTYYLSNTNQNASTPASLTLIQL